MCKKIIVKKYGIIIIFYFICNSKIDLLNITYNDFSNTLNLIIEVLLIKKVIDLDKKKFNYCLL